MKIIFEVVMMGFMPDSAEDLLLAEGLIALSLAVERVRIGVCRELDLTPQQVQLICALDHGPRTSSGLASLLACDKTNITGMVDRLEPRGLVQRVRSDTDRRVVNIALTDAGVEVVVQFRQKAAATFAVELSDWSSNQRRELSGITRAAVEALGPDLLLALEGTKPSPA